MRRIDADALKKNMEFICMSIMAGTDPYNAPLTEIDNAPTVEERPRGKWIYNKYYVWECSHCGGNPHAGTGYVPSIPMMKKQWKFCNLCGAQMGGADNEPN